MLQSDFGAPHLRELVSTTRALFDIAFGWQGLVLAIVICIAIIWGFLKRDNPKWHILWPGIITSTLAILGGGYFSVIYSRICRNSLFLSLSCH